MKHRVFAFLLAACLLLCAAPGAWAVSYTPEQQYEILLQLDALIREEGLESFDEATAASSLLRLVAAIYSGV